MSRIAIPLLAVLLFSCGDDDSDAVTDGTHDASTSTSTSQRDAGTKLHADANADAGAWRAPTVVPPDPESGEPFLLSQTGLYRDIAAQRLAPDLIAFEPRYQLWSDGADKRRWLRLPPGESIDSSDMDHWQFPVGTMAFKEFALDGKRIETRLIMRTGEGADDYWMGAFVWNDDESDARFVPDGEPDARGSAHDVPKVKNCFTCHDGEAGRVLGFSAVQQPDVDAALLSAPPKLAFAVPGDATAAAALGYLHANCAHCHNPQGTARPDTDMNMRLRVSDLEVADTNTFQTTVGVPMQYFDDSPLSLRIAPGDPEQSGVLFRMLERGPKTQMPPLASEIADDVGVAAVRAWIERLQIERL